MARPVLCVGGRRLKIRNLLQWRTQEFFFRRGGSTNSFEDRGQREQGSGGGSPLVRGSGGSCNLVQEISFHIVKFS
jgi:hypothetical protein